MLDGGDIAVGVFNFSEKDGFVSFNIDQLGLPESTGKTLELHNLWEDETVTVKNGILRHPIKGYDTFLCRCRVVNK